jgi:large subunit ribosomal protein L25
MGETSLAVELREQTGKGAARRTRRAGRIPGVVYGAKLDSVAITLDGHALDRLIHTSHAGVNTLIDLEGPAQVSGKTVLVKELQREPVRGGLMHADLFEVNVTETVRVSVPVHLEGTPHGVTMGGLVDHALREIEVDCLPRSIPDEIVVDVSGLDIGDSIHVSDLSLPEGVELQTSDELSVVSVVAPRVEEEEPTAEELEAAAEAAEGEAAAAGEAGEGEGESEGESKDS